MELQTIGQVTRTFGISTRTLRYYEEIGLIKSEKKDDYAYRMYSKDTIMKLQQIIILRKLRIPLKQIKQILQSSDAALALKSFNQNIQQIDDEISALSTIRDILKSFVLRINQSLNTNIRLDLFDDQEVLEIMDSLAITKIKLKEETSMEDLNRADKKLSKLTDKDVRIVYLPPATVASSHFIGDEPEHNAAKAMDKFVLDSNLPQLKPDLRQYGFNHPNPVDETNTHGYEFWVTIPDDMDVPAPLVKKHFEGGLYAAHMIPMGAFEEWGWLWDWAHNNERYLPNILDDGGECMNGLLEEHLNYRNNVSNFKGGVYDNIQLDLLIPIKEKS